MDQFPKASDSFGVSMQRLKEGLQKTIQIFRVYEGDAERECGNYIYSFSSQSIVQTECAKPPRFPSRNYRHCSEREEELETEVSAIELGSDYDDSSNLCSATDDTLVNNISSRQRYYGLKPLAFKDETDTYYRRMLKCGPKQYSGSILKDDTSDTVSIHSQASLRVSLDVKTNAGDVEQNDLGTAVLEHTITTPTVLKQPKIKTLRTPVEYTSSSPESEQEIARYKIYVRKPVEPSPKKVLTFKTSSVSSFEYSPPPTPPFRESPLPPPVTPFSVKSKIASEDRIFLPEKKNYVVDDLAEGPINRFNYALVYPDRSDVMRPELKYLLSYLERSGLEIQLVRGKYQKGNLVFILVHMPIATLVEDTQKQKVRLSCMLPYYPTEDPPNLHWFTMCFAQKQEGPRRTNEQRVFVTSTEKILFIHQRVDRAKFGPEPEQYGIEELIKEDIITAAYPLHDGDAHASWLKKLSDRQNLTMFWGKLARFTHLQPLRMVRKYFGAEIAFYFAWLGYLACLLTPAAIYGCLILVAGIASLSNPEDNRIGEVCSSDRFMCPLCLNYKHCDFAAIKDSCFYSRLNYIFDNNFTLTFPRFMAAWTLIFVMYWKRVENMLKLEWNLYHTNMESFIRSSFLRRLKEQHIEITYKGDPRIPFSWRVVMRTITMLIMLTMLGLLCLTAYVLALLRILLTHKLTIRVDRKDNVNVSLISNGMHSSNIICSMLSGIFIVINSKIFPYIIDWTTALESPRTDREYSVSYTSKLFILECFNNFAYGIYMAFFREFGFWYPGDVAGWEYSNGIRRNMCDPSGCIADLSIYVAIVLSIKVLYHWIETGIYIYRNVKKSPAIILIDQWESDYELTPVNYKLYIPTLYMEPVMKFGFVTLFSGVFPLAPLLVLIDTAVTIRINATMFCQLLRRPPPRRVVGLEMWEGIIRIVSVCGIIISMYILWFTTDFMKRSVYFFYHNSTNNYLFDTISDFKVSDYDIPYEKIGLSKCYYRGNRIPSDKSNKYQFTLRYAEIIMYQHIFTIRYLLGLLAFGGFFYFVIWNHERERPYDEAIDEDDEKPR
ncbi:hypothetical protein ILUMI_23617 [Ignelater luminosus]|uniref:Anoctamin n=1 Tax=Ignelater luminosus TaxID=2038154 RepID=A0A8K0FWU9_IGNLU|nr:hypothetical protein ILUMI_23617 [Ignelater luminosus]